MLEGSGLEVVVVNVGALAVVALGPYVDVSGLLDPAAAGKEELGLVLFRVLSGV